MAHECEECGQQCYCDCDDMGGLPQPSDCQCLRSHWWDEQREDDEDDYDEEDDEFHGAESEWPPPPPLTYDDA